MVTFDQRIITFVASSCCSRVPDPSIMEALEHEALAEFPQRN